MTEATSLGAQGSSGNSTTMRDELSHDASRLADTATHRAEEAADTRKQQATTAAHAVSSAIDKAAGALRQDDQAPDWLASAFQKTAQQVEQLASSIENKDIGEIRSNVKDFARQSPMAFLAASAAVGFAAARFLRAGSEYKSDQQGGSQNFSQRTSGMGYGSSSSGTTGGSGTTGSMNTGATGAVGAASGSELGATGSTGGSTGTAGVDQSVWAPESAPLDREGVIS